jgi:hypothetical protein
MAVSGSRRWRPLFLQGGSMTQETRLGTQLFQRADFGYRLLGKQWRRRHTRTVEAMRTQACPIIFPFQFCGSGKAVNIPRPFFASDTRNSNTDYRHIRQA